MHGLEAEYWGKIDFVYLDREHPDNSEIVKEFNVVGQPLFFLLAADGSTVQRWSGGVDADDLREAFNNHLAETGG